MWSQSQNFAFEFGVTKNTNKTGEHWIQRITFTAETNEALHCGMQSQLGIVV